jgi:undecaprenyl phosphate N,N'-diacetylbacillosamine 1-phosphate transferase
MSTEQRSAVKGQPSVQLVIKRRLDVLVCSLVLVVLLPLLAVLALVIKPSSPGPVFFVQERVGMNGRKFRKFKFRTTTGVPRLNQTAWTEAEENRITRFGRFLRAHGMDELPQLLNIIKGAMSIVGPRPPLPAQIESLTDFERRVFQMRPGVAGLATVWAVTPSRLSSAGSSMPSTLKVVSWA